MKRLEAKPFNQNAENWKRENQLLTPTVLAAGAYQQNRIGTYALSRNRNSLIRSRCSNSCVSLESGNALVTKGFYSPNDTPKPRKNCEDGRFSTSLTALKSCTVDRGCTPAPKDAKKLAVFFWSFSRLSFDINFFWRKNSLQRWSSDFQGLFRVKIRKMAHGSNNLATLL